MSTLSVIVGIEAMASQRVNGKRGIDMVYDSLGDGVCGRKRVTEAKESKVTRATKRALSETCQWATPDMIYNREVGGLTMYQRLWNDKYKVIIEKEDVKLGKCYYEDLRIMYEGADAADSKLIPPENMEVQESLVQACVQMVKCPPNRSVIAVWAQTTTEMNEADAIMVSKMMLRLEPGASQEQRTTATDLLQSLCRLRMFDKHKYILEIMKGTADMILLTVPPFFSPRAAISSLYTCETTAQIHQKEATEI